MEIINNTEEQRKNGRPVSPKNIYTGLILMAAGILWMCYNLDILGYRLFDAVFSWQMLLMVLGGYFFALRKWALGGVTFAIGAIFAVSDWFGLRIPVEDVILPMIVVAVGVVFLLQWKSK